MNILNGVIPVAGLGTRLLPSTKSQPKEMLPVGRKPVVQYVVEEFERAGVNRILFVTGRSKTSIENHFDSDSELEQSLREGGKMDLLETLDFGAFAYRAILFGYAMISAGLILGALWAKFAWGDWWSWDPKENWALITWLVYTAYLHFRFTKSVGPRGLAWLSIVGFLAVMFTYLGVNYLPAAQNALHSYTME